MWLAGGVLSALYGTVFALSKSSDSAKLVLHKLNIWIHGIVHLVFTNETMWKPNKLDDPASLSECQNVVKKTVIFIRHGESKWNEVFNKGKGVKRFFTAGFFIRLFSAMFWETIDAVSGDSVFLDSPLSQEGIDQAQSLADFIEKKEQDPDEKVEKYRQILMGEGESIVCTSNLRRAIATTTIGLWPRFRKGGEQIHVLSTLQESSRNVDTMALSRPDSVPPLSVTQTTLGNEFDTSKVYITSENKGNKPICQKGKTRMFEFCDWVFNSNGSSVVIAGGHSLWFRNFFKSFLPHASSHPAKKAKIKNGGAVAFTFCMGKLGDQILYKVEEETIVPVFLGFDV